MWEQPAASDHRVLLAAAHQIQYEQSFLRAQSLQAKYWWCSLIAVLHNMNSFWLHLDQAHKVCWVHLTSKDQRVTVEICCELMLGHKKVWPGKGGRWGQTPYPVPFFNAGRRWAPGWVRWRPGGTSIALWRSWFWNFPSIGVNKYVMVLTTAIS